MSMRGKPLALLFGLVGLWLGLAAPGRAEAAASAGAARGLPRLVAVITIDGLPQEQVLRFADQLGPGGFKRLMARGAWYSSAYYGHSMTETAVGHATILTGAHPYRHGLVGNEWFDRVSRQQVYCVEDPRSQNVGEPTKDHAGTSPRNLRVTTVGDELRLATGMQAKVLSASLKDRGAMLTGGKLGTAYWYSSSTGRFITSTYYRTDYPEWWSRFYANTPQDGWFGKFWEPLLPRAAYAGSAADDRPYHTNHKGLGKKFPHPVTGGLDRPGPDYYAALAYIPFGDEYLLAFTKAAIQGENLGKNRPGVPDVLAVSFSANDYVNHLFGPESMQSQDQLLRLDRTLADLLAFLDRWVGADNTLVVLTADHGFTNTPEYCTADMKTDGGRIDPDKMLEELNAHLSARFGAAKYAIYWRRPTIYLDYEVIDGKHLGRAEVENVAAEFLTGYPGLHSVFTRTQLILGQLPPTRFAQMAARTWSRSISGDLLLLPKNCWYLFGKPHELTAMHGGPWTHDTNVPLMFMGTKWIAPGRHDQMVEIVDIAPTLARLLNLRPPDGSEGRVLHELFLPAPRPRP
jgi:predicted AlkP superfamily pyrophosphatase or phosphodiesterase